MAYLWQAGSGRPLTLRLSLDDAQSCSHQGWCDQDVADLLRLDRIIDQVAMWEPEILAAELGEYGAWDVSELTDHDTNVERMIWIACCDVSENPDDYREDEVSDPFSDASSQCEWNGER
jgi:hypothetical protein